MNIYLLLITFTSTLAIVFGFLFFGKNQNKEGFFLLLFILFSAVWMIFYYIYFSSISDPVLLTKLAKVGYWSGIPCVFSFLFFIKYFQKGETHIFDLSTISILLVYVVLMIIYCYTDLIITGVIYDPIDGIYREITGALYSFTYIAYATFLLSVIFITRKRLISTASLARKRLVNIVVATFSLVGALVFLQLVLPLFNIWILEKQIILIYLIYIVYIYQTLRRYYFSSLFYGIGRIISFIGGIIVAIVAANLIRIGSYEMQGGNTHSYWGIQDNYGMIDAIVIILVFYLLYTFLLKKLLGDYGLNIIKEELQGLKKQISHITSISQLNNIIQEKIGIIFKIKHASIIFFDGLEFSKTQRFFQKKYGNALLINDDVFMDENQEKYPNIFDIKTEFNADVFLVLPIYNSKNIPIAMLVLGTKFLGEFYSKNEIAILKEFAFFLEIHLKYIRTYTEMIDLSENLDSKVDQKTIEYNDLINKQKEFISMISHEIRSPIGSTIFQVDSLIDDMEYKKISIGDVHKNIKNIGNQLIHIGELLKKLFSIQYFDTRNVVLLKEKIHIGTLLEKEFEIYSRMYENISFIKKISPDIGFVNIDKIHFQQVLTNLLENAIKFASNDDPVILIESYKGDGGTFCINIEDNGAGYGDMDTSIIFEKYSTGSHAKLGLGMGLYLCKRIITMHEGNITAEHGRILGGASFLISLPI